jgi:hypothetical protein
MNKLFAAGVIATVLAASTALAFELPSGPQPIRDTEGPDIRLTEDGQSTQPIKPIEGPNTRYAALQPIKGTEGPDIRLTEVQQPSMHVEGPEGPDVR